MAQLVKNPPAMWETWVRSLGWEDPLEQGKATHSFSGLENSMDCKGWDKTEQLSLCLSFVLQIFFHLLSNISAEFFIFNTIVLIFKSPKKGVL